MIFDHKPSEEEMLRKQQTYTLESQNVGAATNPQELAYIQQHEKSAADIVEFTQGFVDDDIVAVWNFLDGKIKVNNVWIRPEGCEPILNNVGKLRVVQTIQSVSNIGTFNANFTTEQANYYAKNIKQRLRHLLESHSDRFGLFGGSNPSCVDIGQILDGIVMPRVKNSISRSINAGERNVIRTVTRQNFVRTETPHTEEKRKWF